MSKIYQREESQARFTLAQFILDIGRPVSPDIATTNGISCEELLRVFSVFNKKDAYYLTDTAIEHLLLAGGWIIESDVNQLYLNITTENFKQLDKTKQSYILNWIPYPTQIKYRGIYNGYVNAGEAPVEPIIANFIKYFCIPISNTIPKQYLHKTQNRGSLNSIYQYFHLICEKYGITNIPIKKTFYEILTNKYNVKITQGVVKGKSGVRTLKDYAFPSTEEDIRLSIKYGISIITADLIYPNTVKVTTKGIFERLTNEEKIELQDTAIRRFAGDAFKQTKTFQETTMGSSSDRTETQIHETSESKRQEDANPKQSGISGRKENNLSINVRANTELQKPQIPETKDERTSDRDESSIAAESTPQDESADIEHEELYDSDIEYEDEYGTDAVEASTDAIEESGTDIESDDQSTEEEVAPYETTEDWPEPMDDTEELWDPMENNPRAKAFLEDYPEEDDEADEEPVVVDFNYLVRICKTTAQDPDMFTLEDLQELLSKVNTELKAEDVYPQLIQELRK